MKMKKIRWPFLITEIILCMLAVLFTYRIFDHETPEKRLQLLWKIPVIKTGIR